MDKILADLLTLGMMLRDYICGNYRDVSWWLIATVIFAMLYVISPFDLFPDCIPVLGQLDDVAVVMLCLKSMATELEKYRNWNRG